MSVKSTLKVGRRKTAVARAYLTSGNGKITVNKKNADEYFKTPDAIEFLIYPLKITNTLGTYNININVNGGGISGQLGAIRLAIARALVDKDENFRSILRKEGLLTRDPRMVERKKYGKPKARKRFQFSKR